MKLRNLSYLFVINTTRVCVFALCALTVLLGYNIYNIKAAPVFVQQQGFPKNTYELQTINDPGMNLDFIVSWVKNAVSELYNFDINNYQSQSRLNALKPKFTSSGFSQYLNRLLGSDILKTVKKNIGGVSAVIDDAAITNHYRFQFVKENQWNIQIPILFSYDIPGEDSGGLTGGDNYLQTITIEKVPAIEAPLSGVKITNIAEFKRSGVPS